MFITNKLPAVRAKLRIDVEDIRAHNPSVIYVRGTGYGSKGPDVDLGGYDALGYWARAGHAASVKPPEIDYMPKQPVPALGDSIGAMFIAGGIGSALFHRERTGEGTVVDVSLLATGMWALGAGIGVSQVTQTAYIPTPLDPTQPRNPLVGLYRTLDDRWIALSMLQGFHYWPEVCRVLGRPEWVGDPRFDSHQSLFEHGHAASELLASSFETRTLEDWKGLLRDLKGQWAPVQDSLNIAEDPMVIANDYLTDVVTEDGIPFKLVASPVQFDDQVNVPRRSPGFNEHGDDILRDDLGMTDEQILDLKISGVVA